jgi:hypothetical protein
MDAATPRKRDGGERRRELCDAGIQVLAEHGSRGLTHGQVDRYAAVPVGTTSYYYRTRAALLRGIGKRVAEIDFANLRSVIDEPLDPQSPFAHLTELTLMQANGPGLMLNRARHELLLGAARIPIWPRCRMHLPAGSMPWPMMPSLTCNRPHRIPPYLPSKPRP